MDQTAIFQTVKHDFEAVNTTIHQQLSSHVPLVETIADYIVNSGGKRMRPLLVLLCGGMTSKPTAQHHLLAATIEFLHTATLLHDDVVDTSNMRRGRPTANANWGNAPSVLVGDFLYARSFEMLVELGDLRVMNSLAAATRKIAEGEVHQLMNINNPDISEAEYMEVIRGKTAILFQASTEAAGIISGCSDAEVQKLADYGLNLGLAFQLTDDVLDYSGNSKDLGKNVGDDLAEGKPTLPLIHAMQKGNADETAIIRRCIEEGGLDHLNEVLAIIKRTSSLEYSIDKAKTLAKTAKQSLNEFADSPFKEALLSLADISVQRNH